MKKLVFATMAIVVMLALVGCKDEEDSKPSPTVTEVTVTYGGTHQQLRQGDTSDVFSVVVDGKNKPAQTVTWSLVGETDDTAIANTVASFDSAARKVTVTADAEIGVKFRVKATSTVNKSKSGYSEVFTVVSESTKFVESIRVDATAATVKKTYSVMELLDTTNVKVYAVYDDDDATEEDVTEHVTWDPEQLTTAGTSVTVTGTYTDEEDNEFTGTYTVAVEKRTLTADDFQITAASMGNLTGQNIRDTITAIVAEKKESVTYDTGAITVLYGGAAALPNKAGTFAITINVAANDIYNAATGLSMGENLVIDKVELTAGDFTFTPFADQQVLVAEAASKTLNVTWKENKIWNTNGAAGKTVYYTADSAPSTELSAITATEGWYKAHLKIPALADYYDAVDLELFSFQVVAAHIPVGTAQITIDHWDFVDKAPAMEGGVVSKTGIDGAAKTKSITITGTFAAVEWYLNGVKDASVTGNSYTFNSAALSLGGPQFVTVRVQIDAEWFSRTVSFTVNP